MEPVKSPFLEAIENIYQSLPLSLREITLKLEYRGPMLVILICVAPFMQPIPIPGVSTVLGLIIALQGLALLTPSKKVILFPQLGNKIITQTRFELFKKGANRIYPLFAKFIKKRGHLALNNPFLTSLSGLLIISLALFLSLPLPIPSSNFLPAIGIFSIALAHLEEDFVLLIMGYSYTLLIFYMIIYASVFLGQFSWSNFF